MSTHTTLPIPSPKCDASKLSHFRFGDFEQGILLTTDHGAWHWLDNQSFNAFLAGSLPEDSPEFKTLGEKGFIRSKSNLDEWAQAVQRRKNFLGIGPALHQIQLHNGKEALSVETAKAVVDHMMQSTSTVLEVELHQDGGEVDGSLLDFIISYAMEKNRYENKTILWALNAPLNALDDKAIEAALKGKCDLHTRVYGAEEIHDKICDTSYQSIRAFIDKTLATAQERGSEKPHFKATLQVTKHHIGHVQSTLKGLEKLGFSTLRINPQLVGDNAIDPIDFLSFYKEALATLLDNASGMQEGNASALASTILRPDPSLDPKYRSPGGAGLSVHAYDVFGGIYPNASAIQSPEPSMFQIGTAGQTSYDDTLTHPTLKTLAIASILDCLPGFSDHWATPFLSVDPVNCYLQSGNFFESLPTSPRTKVALGQVEYLFSILIQGESDRRKRLESWLKA